MKQKHTDEYLQEQIALHRERQTRTLYPNDPNGITLDSTVLRQIEDEVQQETNWKYRPFLRKRLFELAMFKAQGAPGRQALSARMTARRAKMQAP